jgi:hypothetical protein
LLDERLGDAPLLLDERLGDAPLLLDERLDDAPLSLDELLDDVPLLPNKSSLVDGENLLLHVVERNEKFVKKGNVQMFSPSRLLCCWTGVATTTRDGGGSSATQADACRLGGWEVDK